MEISKEFKKWLDAAGMNRSLRRNVDKVVEIEEKHLFNGELLSDVILIAQKLMVEHGDVTYSELWTGYEDMVPSLVWNEEESYEDYELRISDLHIKYLKEKEKLKKDEERTKLEAEMKALQEKIAKLK